jgi:hypothetical protein
MKKHYPFSIFVLTFLILAIKSESQVLFNESFPNSANTGFLRGPGSYTFSGDIGTWNVVAGDATGGGQATGAVTGPPSFSSPNSIVLANYINNTASVSYAEFSSPTLDLSPYAGNSNINVGFRLNTTDISGTNSCLTYVVQVYNGSTFTTIMTMTAQQLVSTYGTGWGVVSLNIPLGALTSGFKLFFTGFNASGCNVSDQFLYIDDVQIVNGAVTLPVNLLSFSVSYNNLAAQLKWSAEEINTSFYSIERSIDGKNFLQIGTVKALNNNTKTDYSFTDNLLSYQSPSVFYRLSIKDVDGRTSNSKILFMKIASSFDKGMIITPNPASASPNIILSASKQAITNIEVYDALGKRKLLQRVSLAQGSNSILLNTGQLTKGIYIVKATIDGFSQSAKLVIQ